VKKHPIPFILKNPDHKHPASWVRWLAQDADGTWWGFEHEPNESHVGWYENEVGRCQRLGSGTPNGRWRETLQAIGPENSGPVHSD
jgi:hypothetical protein